MNKKRQTIWLVSMLSIMVVLSAYYLFTDDVDEFDGALGTDADLDSIVLNLLEDADEQAGAADEDILLEFEAEKVSGSGFFLTTQMKRNEEFDRGIEELLEISTNPESSETEVAEAQNRINELRMRQETVEELEETLAQEYGNAVIIHKNNEWNVIVQAEQLEKSQVVGIIGLVTDKLGIHVDQIRVQKAI